MYFVVWSVVIAIAIAYKLYVKLTTGICKCTTRLDGKTVLITGANTGIGKETALDMAKRGARVILACRNMEKAKKAKDEIISASGNHNVVIRSLDLTSLCSVREFAREILASESRLDVLINNAGAAGLEDEVTEDGLQVVLQINHYGPFLLTNLLLDLVKKSAPSRIVFVASMNHHIATIDEETVDVKQWILGHQEYHSSKLFNVLTSNALAEKLRGTGVTVNSLHPGVIYTELWKSLPAFILIPIDFVLRFIWKTAVEGAQTTIHVAVSEELEGVTGKYFVDCKMRQPSIKAQNKELAKRLWEKSAKCVNLSPPEDTKLQLHASLCVGPEIFDFIPKIKSIKLA